MHAYETVSLVFIGISPSHFAGTLSDSTADMYSDFEHAVCCRGNPMFRVQPERCAPCKRLKLFHCLFFGSFHCL